MLFIFTKKNKISHTYYYSEKLRLQFYINKIILKQFDIISFFWYVLKLRNIKKIKDN